MRWDEIWDIDEMENDDDDDNEIKWSIKTYHYWLWNLRFFPECYGSSRQHCPCRLFIRKGCSPVCLALGGVFGEGLFFDHLRWDENLRCDEMRWDDMRWDWDEMRWDVRWDEMRLRWDDMRWDEMRCDEMRWGWWSFWWRFFFWSPETWTTHPYCRLQWV